MTFTFTFTFTSNSNSNSIFTYTSSFVSTTIQTRALSLRLTSSLHIFSILYAVIRGRNSQNDLNVIKYWSMLNRKRKERKLLEICLFIFLILVYPKNITHMMRRVLNRFLFYNKYLMQNKYDEVNSSYDSIPFVPTLEGLWYILF